MSQQPPDPPQTPAEGDDKPDDLGSLTVEDEPEGTVDPADLAGTAKGSDADVGYNPEFSQADDATNES